MGIFVNKCRVRKLSSVKLAPPYVTDVKLSIISAVSVPFCAPFQQETTLKKAKLTRRHQGDQELETRRLKVKRFHTSSRVSNSLCQTRREDWEHLAEMTTVSPYSWKRMEYSSWPQLSAPGVLQPGLYSLSLPSRGRGGWRQHMTGREVNSQTWLLNAESQGEGLSSILYRWEWSTWTHHLIRDIVMVITKQEIKWKKLAEEAEINFGLWLRRKDRSWESK